MDYRTGRLDAGVVLHRRVQRLRAMAATRRGGSAVVLGSLALFFAALFTKQTTITMVATLAAWDHLVANRPVRPTWTGSAPTCPSS